MSWGGLDFNSDRERNRIILLCRSRPVWWTVDYKVSNSSSVVEGWMPSAHQPENRTTYLIFQSFFSWYWRHLFRVPRDTRLNLSRP
jgi:hypothetical protein